MGVSKSGYYRWRGRQGKPNRYEQDRQLLTMLLAEQHKKHPSHGYHMLAKAVFEATGCTVCIDSETGKCQVLSARVADFVRCVLFVPAEQYWIIGTIRMQLAE